ncbi:MAG: homoserine O-acetyltransferase MetX [Bacillota bacterium]
MNTAKAFLNSNTIDPVTEFVTLFSYGEKLRLESGETLSPVRVAYQTYGELNQDGTNAILICHALTGNSHAAGILTQIESDPYSEIDCLTRYSKMNYGKAGWWDALIGPEKAFDTNKYFVICSNILGSCYGTTGPSSRNPETGEPFQSSFPVITVRDMVKLQRELIKYLGVNKLVTVAGGSLGGMQVLEWAVMYPELVESIIPIAAPLKHSDWAIGLNETARRAIKNDPAWKNGQYTEQPHNGFELARMIAMITYRSDASFKNKFNRERFNNSSDHYDTDNLFQVQNYLNYQGQKLVKRFDANTYITLSNAMDLHDICYNRGSMHDVLSSVTSKVLSIGISSDVLYPASEQKEISSLIRGSRYVEINSVHGHDAFLIEFEQMEKAIREIIS